MDLTRQYSLITGGAGLVGTALRSEMSRANLKFLFPSSTELDLIDLGQIKNYLRDNEAFDGQGPYSRIGCVFHLAGKVGGLRANTEHLARFYAQNAIMGANLLHSCAEAGIPRVVSVLSTCIYPDAGHVVYPLSEEQLHMGPPHSSNYGYAYAKRMLDIHTRTIRKEYGLRYISVIPNNVFGENDNFDLESGHVIPSLIRKVHEAKINNLPEVEIWGDGSALREFTYSGDVARILLRVSEEYDDELPLNIGNTGEHSILSVAKKIAEFMEYDGRLRTNSDKPSGQFRKPSSNKRLLSLTSWRQEDYTPFDAALQGVCRWFMASYPNVKGVAQFSGKSS